jgi:geranylgeranyl diphosphate synthase, type I
VTSYAGATDTVTVQAVLRTFSRQVDAALTGFLDRQDLRAAPLLDDPACLGHWTGLTEDLRATLAGGKRIRPLFCHLAWWGAGGSPEDPGIARIGAALELLHAFALVHDDVIDASDTRRGLPTVHHRHAGVHRVERWRGDPDAYGIAVAILAGDLLLGWCHELLDASGLPPQRLRAGRQVLAEAFHELVLGQYLDVLGQVGGPSSAGAVDTVNLLKTAKYTVERPLHLGAVLAGADLSDLPAYTAYARPLGQAFQLRDDLLGLFGDPAATGKPVGDDLRSGKATLLMVLARERADRAQAATLAALVGRPDLDVEGVDRLARIVVSTGARAEVERQIGALAERAREATIGLCAPPVVRRLLREVVAIVVDRTS